MAKFVIKRERFSNPVFIKPSYDSYNGMWTPYPQKAKTWKTRAGAEKFFARFASIWEICGSKGAKIEEME